MKRRQMTFLLAVLMVCFSFWSGGCGSDDAGSSETDGDGPVATDGDTIDGDVPIGDGDTGDGDVGDGDTSDGDGVIIIPSDGDDDAPQPECLEDRDCPGTDYCDTSFNVCRPRKRLCEPCTTSKECGTDDDACLPSGVCGKWCGEGRVCPDGYNCETITGVPDKQCVFDDSITGGTVGSNCCWNDNCEAPLVCNTLTAKCTEGCTGASACPPGMVCFDDPNDDRNGFCTVGCLINEDCQGGEVCYNGECVVGDCADKYDCPLEYKCNTSNFSCYAGCDVDEDCYAYNECVDGQCIERVGCEGTWQCSLSFMCQVELPDGDREDRGCCFDPREERTGECANNQPQGPQPFCKPCEDNSSQSTECGDNGQCVEFTDPDTEEVLGRWCIVRWDCTTRNENGLDQGTQECPRGYTCTKIEDGELQGKWCIASCNRDGFAWPE